MSQAKKSYRPIPPITEGDAHKLVALQDQVIANFSGDISELEAALGMYMIGRLTGWKVLVLIHNKRTLRKYEDILGVKVRDEFPEEGPFADKSLALNIVKKVGNFWKAVSGELKDDDLREKRRELAL